MSRRLRRKAMAGKGSNRILTGHQRQVAEQSGSGYAASSSIQEDQQRTAYTFDAEDEHQWHRLGDNWDVKDSTLPKYLAAHHQCYQAYEENPLAFAIVELTTSFVLGEGITVAASNKRVQQIIDDFWHDPDNRMDERIYSLSTELSLYGEQFIHFFVEQYDGSVVVRQVDPSLIDQIVTDPEDIETALWYHRRPISQAISGVGGGPPIGILRSQTSAGSGHTADATDSLRAQDTEGAWFKAGEEVVHVAINKVSNAKRGRSDLETLLPWLKRYQEWLLERVRINKYKNAFFWDVKMQGADKKTIDRMRMEWARPPQSGTVIIHNDKEEWNAVEPKIGARDVSDDGRVLRLMIAAGAMLPEHYLSDGDNGNRATATEMSLPTILKFKRRQRVVRHMLQLILDRVLKEAQKVGKIEPQTDIAYKITFPEIDSDEHRTLAESMQWLVPALQIAKSEGWVSDETAMKIMFEYCGEEIDVHQERVRIANQRRGEMS